MDARGRGRRPGCLILRPVWCVEDAQGRYVLEGPTNSKAFALLVRALRIGRGQASQVVLLQS